MIPVGTFTAPTAPTLPTTEYTVQNLVLHESIPQELISDGPAPVLPDIPSRRWMRLKGRAAKVEQWRDLCIVGSNYFRLEYMCLQVFMLLKRPSFGGPGVDSIFDSAFLRAIGTVVGNLQFYSLENFVRDKLGNIYNSIQSAYDEGAECIRDGLLKFYPELVIPSGIQRGTVQWNNVLRTAVEDLINRPGGYLHLVSVTCPLTHLITSNSSNQVSQNGELLQYQHPGFLAFMEALLFDTKISLGANNPGSFSTFRSGFIALGATWVSIHYPLLLYH